LITGADCLSGLEYLGITGQLVVFTDGDELAVPTLENLGVESNLYFLTDAIVDENKSQQYGRVCTLLVSNRKLDGLDLSQLRIKFSVKRSDTMTPNVADIRVYNLDEATAILIRKEFTKVILQAGYADNFGVIFQGNIKQVILGRNPGKTRSSTLWQATATAPIISQS
jgi:hypothetical protein